MKIAAALLIGCVATAAACNGGPATDPDCQNKDDGSCGMACCKLQFSFPPGKSAEEVQKALFTTLSNGGPDGRYAMTSTAYATFGFQKFPSKVYPYEFIGQAYHTTPFPDGKLVKAGPFRDTVNFLIYEDAAHNNRTTMRAFSISEINGALGDNSMNYKAIMLVARKLSVVDSTLKWDMTHPDTSCPSHKH